MTTLWPPASRLTKSPPGKPFFSVILCTYNRRNLVLSTLASLRRQTLPYEQFEVIVVGSGRESGWNLVQARVTVSREAIEPAPAVHDKEPPVARPVRRLELPIVTIDRLDASGLDLHGSEGAADGTVGLAERAPRDENTREEEKTRQRGSHDELRHRP